MNRTNDTSEVQAVVFKTDPPNKWTAETSRAWLDKHDFDRMKKVDITKNSLRYRIVTPKRFKSFTTKVIKSDMGNINLVIGRKPKPKPKKKKGAGRFPHAKPAAKVKMKKKGTVHFKSVRTKKT